MASPNFSVPSYISSYFGVLLYTLKLSTFKFICIFYVFGGKNKTFCPPQD